MLLGVILVQYSYNCLNFKASDKIMITSAVRDYCGQSGYTDDGLTGGFN